MTRRHITSGSTFEAQIGYSRAVVDGRFVFVSGTTGYDYATMTLARGVVAQARQVIANIDSALREAGASLDDVVRVRYILPKAADFEPCWPLLREAFARARPAATMIQARLLDPRMKIEIEVTALKPSAARAASAAGARPRGARAGARSAPDKPARASIARKRNP
jgi:enamine deaminase RidA (YjgF/YER057c/UK114 family)